MQSFSRLWPSFEDVVGRSFAFFYPLLIRLFLTENSLPLRLTWQYSQSEQSRAVLRRTRTRHVSESVVSPLFVRSFHFQILCLGLPSGLRVTLFHNCTCSFKLQICSERNTKPCLLALGSKLRNFGPFSDHMSETFRGTCLCRGGFP